MTETVENMYNTIFPWIAMPLTLNYKIAHRVLPEQ